MAWVGKAKQGGIMRRKVRGIKQRTLHWERQRKLLLAGGQAC